MLSRFTPTQGLDSQATWPSPYRMFWPSLSWLLELACFMSLAEESGLTAVTLSPLLVLKSQRLIGALVPPPYRSFSPFDEGQVKTSDVMSWVRNSRNRAEVMQL